MSRAQECGGCMSGNHDQHDRDHGLRVGVIGGTYCDCTGDCAARFAARSDLLQHLLDRAYPPGPTTTDPITCTGCTREVTVGGLCVHSGATCALCCGKYCGGAA